MFHIMTELSTDISSLCLASHESLYNKPLSTKETCFSNKD